MHNKWLATAVGIQLLSPERPLLTLRNLERIMGSAEYYHFVVSIFKGLYLMNPDKIPVKQVSMTVHFTAS